MTISMPIIEELFGFGSPLDDAALAEALRRTDGDVSQAIQEHLESAKLYLKRLLPAQIERERSAMQGYLANDRQAAELPAGEILQWRAKELKERTAALRADAAELSDPALLMDAIEDTREEMTFYEGDPDREEAFARARLKLLKLSVQKGLMSQVAEILQKRCEVVESMKLETLRDQQVYLSLRKLMEERRSELQPGASSDRNNKTRAGEERDWLIDADILRDLTQDKLRRLLCAPPGKLAERGAASILDELLSWIVDSIPDPTLRDIYGDAFLTDWVSTLSSTAWSGVDQASRLLWGISEPLAILQAPASLELPPSRPAGCSLWRRDGEASALTVSFFKFIPLPAISDWDKWLRHEATKREENGGYRAASAEPWATDEQDATLHGFETARVLRYASAEPANGHAVKPGVVTVNGQNGHDDPRRLVSRSKE